MPSRKQTPDILAEILNDETAHSPGPATPPPSAPPRPRKPSQPKPAAAPKRAAEATGWEYRLVTFQDYHGWRPRFVNGKELADWFHGPTLSEYLAGLGEEGWELASACAGERMFGNTDRYQLFFKRRKTAQG